MNLSIAKQTWHWKPYIHFKRDSLSLLVAWGGWWKLWVVRRRRIRWYSWRAGHCQGKCSSVAKQEMGSFGLHPNVERNTARTWTRRRFRIAFGKPDHWDVLRLYGGGQSLNALPAAWGCYKYSRSTEYKLRENNLESVGAFRAFLVPDQLHVWHHTQCQLKSAGGCIFVHPLLLLSPHWSSFYCKRTSLTH